ncbi:mitochondrial ribosomal protein MRP51, partial [Peziza echinospora]
MSSKAMSPGAHLLRHSRLLSLPPPIPPPTAYTSLRSGKTFPTQQAISTPSSSHSRGDWGLKRNLPLKVTQKYLKYNELDTIEHRTTFESAHGEVMALRRWQEMDIPLTLPSEGGHTDETLSPSARRAQALKNHPTARQNASLTKWRYESPYLQNLPPRALRAWLLKKVRPRREEFITFLKRNEYLQASSKLSSGAPNHEPTAKDLADIKIDLAKLRNDPLVLESLITAFLDLPKNSPPPATHPSAGLQYTRSTAYMPNHPYTGPDNGPGRSFPGRQFQSRWQTLAGIAGLVA